MEAFSGPNEAFTMDSVGISEPISDMQDQKSVSKHLADRQYIEDRVMSSEETLLYWYESITMQYLGLQNIIDPIMINEEHNQEQVSAAAFYGPSFGVDNGESAVYPETKSTVRVEREDNNLQNHTPGHGENHEVTIDKEKCMDKRLGSRGKGHTAHGKMKKRKTDQYVGQSVVETYFQKSKRDRCKSLQSSSACKSHEEKSNTKLDGDPPELPLNIAKAECQKDYIHLRARRGQATNSHSLAERVRREKISQRMKVLQELVPGCNKVTGKVLVLEEIINYVQSMQKQVEILSLKLACAVPLCNSELETNYGQPFT